MFMEDYDSYFKYAKLLTELHAMPKELKNLDNTSTLGLKKYQNTMEVETEEPKQGVQDKKTALKK